MQETIKLGPVACSPLAEFLATLKPRWAEIIRLTLEPQEPEEPDIMGGRVRRYWTRREIAQYVGLTEMSLHQFFSGNGSSNIKFREALKEARRIQAESISHHWLSQKERRLEAMFEVYEEAMRPRLTRMDTVGGVGGPTYEVYERALGTALAVLKEARVEMEGLKIKSEVTGADGGPVRGETRIDPEQLEELNQMIRELEKLKGEAGELDFIGDESPPEPR